MKISQLKLNLTVDYVRSILEYDSETGIFRWKERPERSLSWNKRWAGKVAGCKRADGYITINIHNAAYFAHRLAWLWMTGEWSAETVDHEDTIKNNNRWGNLRIATPSQNGANRAMCKNNKTGYKGVIFNRKLGKWIAQLTIHGKTRHLGCFSSPEDASIAYAKAADSFHAEFARVA